MAARKLKITGESDNATLTVSIDGSQVYTGPAISSSCLAEITIDNDNTTQTSKSVVVACTSGSIKVGPVLYNYYPVMNPALDATEKGYYDSGNAASAPLEIQNSVSAKGGWTVISEEQFGSGSEIRSNIVIDGQAPDPAEYASPPFTPFAGWAFEIFATQSIGFDIKIDPIPS